MNQREKMLVAAVLCLVGLILGKSLFGSYQRSLTQKRNTLDAAKQELRGVDFELLKGRTADSDLARWQDQSLPNFDPENPDRSRELAATEYSKWLNKTLDDAGMDVQNVQPTPPTRLIHLDIRSIGYQVNAKGSRSNIVRFLYEFYRKAQLQQITWLDVRADGSNLTVQLRVEALMLPGATNKDLLPEEAQHPFRLASVNDYRTSIEGRNIFEPFRMPREPRQAADTTEPTPDPPSFDHSRFAQFTGTTMGSEGLVAWINVQTTGEPMFRSEGDAINVGQWSAKVVSIEPLAIVVEESDGTRRRVKAGTMLRDGKRIAGRDESGSGGPGI